MRLEILGSCKLTDMKTGQAVEFRTRKAKCLIGLVALSPHKTLSREKLASFLWDPAPEEQARASLRQCLKEIRQSIGDQADKLIVADRLNVHVSIDNFRVDALAICDQLELAKVDIDKALQLAQFWTGDLFGDNVPPAPVFEAWVRIERARIKTSLSNTLTDHLEGLISSNNYQNARLAEELVRIEPSHELAHQFLMKFYAQRGDQAGALRQFARLDQVLAEELDSEPSQESTDLLVAIKRGDIAIGKIEPSHQPTLHSVKKKSLPKIAIRPPLTRYHDNSKDYLADGFADLTKNCLSKFRCWIALSWPSIGFDSKVKIDYLELAKMTDVDYVIDTVLDWRHQPGRLFVALVDCSNSNQIWSDTFAVAETELQSMSSMLSGAIASKLASQINYLTLLRFARTNSGDATAYDLWLRGDQLVKDWKPKSDELAKQFFERAIELDPGLARAYASIASLLNTQAMTRPGYVDDIEDKKRAFELAQKAIALDPFDSRNHLNMAWSWLLEKSEERADSHFKLAVDLNPYDSETLIACAMGMAFLGHLQIAKQWSELALKLNPLHPEYFLGYICAIKFLDGQYEESIKVASRCPDIFLDIPAWTASAHALLSNPIDAVNALKAFEHIIGEKWEGPHPPDRAEKISWFIHSIPILWKKGQAKLEEGLSKAASLSQNTDAVSPAI